MWDIVEQTHKIESTRMNFASSHNDSGTFLMDKESFKLDRILRGSQRRQNSKLKFTLQYFLERLPRTEEMSVTTKRFNAIKDFLAENSYKSEWGEYLIYPGFLLESIRESEDMRRLKHYLEGE